MYALPSLAYSLQCVFNSHVPRQRSRHLIDLKRPELYLHSRVVTGNGTVRLSELPRRAVISRSWLAVGVRMGMTQVVQNGESLWACY